MAHYLERHGSMDIEIRGNSPVIRDDMLAYCDHDGIEIVVGDFDPDMHPFEDLDFHSCTLRGPATRRHWDFMYRVARTLLRDKIVMISDDGKFPQEVRMDGTIIEFK